MLTSILIGVAVFAAQVVGYRVVTSKLRARAAYRQRLAGIRTSVVPHIAGPARNRVGDN